MQTLPWLYGPGPLTHRVCNMPASLRQTARKDVEPHIVWGSLRAGCLLLGASFFSYLDAELGFGNIDKLIKGFGFDFSFRKLGP